MIAGHAYPPHCWYDPATRKLYQTVLLSRSAFALYQGNGCLTNRARALQCEIAGRAAEAANWPIEWLNNITEDVVVPFCQWVSGYMGATIDLSFHPEPGAIPGSASEYAPQRVDEHTWSYRSGLYSHRHVPQNDHWDTGGLDTPRIAEHARLIIAGMLGSSLPGYTPQGGDVAEVYFRKRPVGFDDAGTPGPIDDAYDHYKLPAGAEIVVATCHPDSMFTSVIYGPGFNRGDTGAVVREVRWGSPGVYTTRSAGQHTIVVAQGMPVDVRAVY
jgi:hypothetical protein